MHHCSHFPPWPPTARVSPINKKKHRIYDARYAMPSGWQIGENKSVKRNPGTILRNTLNKGQHYPKFIIFGSHIPMFHESYFLYFKINSLNTTNKAQRNEWMHGHYSIAGIISPETLDRDAWAPWMTLRALSSTDIWWHVVLSSILPWIPIFSGVHWLS